MKINNKLISKELYERVAMIQYLFSQTQDILPKDDPAKAFCMLSALVIEVGEAQQEDKRWKVLLGDKRKHQYNKKKKTKELVDILLFLLASIEYSDITLDELNNTLDEVLEEVKDRAYEQLEPDKKDYDKMFGHISHKCLEG